MTRLLDEPFAEGGFHFVLRQGAIGARIFEATAHLIEHVEMILDVLNRAVIGALVQEFLDILFRRIHILDIINS